MRLARRLYDARKELCENLNLRAIMAQQLVPHRDGKGRRAAIEVLLNTPRVSDLIGVMYAGEIVEAARPQELVELGSGSSEKTGVLLSAYSMGYTEETEVFGDDKLLLDMGLATVMVCATLLAACATAPPTADR